MLVKIKKIPKKRRSKYKENNKNIHHCFYVRKREKTTNKKRKIAYSVFQIVVGITTIITAVFACLAFNNIGNLREIKNKIKYTPNSQAAIDEWKSELTCLHIGYSRNYIENIIGQPKLADSIFYESLKISKCIYSNSYFTLLCLYNDDSSLLGFLIIGNNYNFNFKNYRCGFSLFDYTINETESFCFERGVQSYIFLRNNHSNRLDNNSYYFECNYQHSKGATSSCIIGYGICDIGEIPQLLDFQSAALSMHLEKSINESFAQLHESTVGDSIRDFPINCFFVMSDFIGSVDFISTHICSYSNLGISRDEYANLQLNYEQSIEKINSQLDTTENIK